MNEMKVTLVLTKGDAGRHQPIKVEMPNTPMTTDDVDRLRCACKAFENSWLAPAPEPKKDPKAK